MLQIPVIVEADLVADKRVRFDAFTLVVNAQGGLLEMSFPLRSGQRLSLVNPASGVKQSCKVVGLRRSQDTDFLVAFELDSPTPHFWPIAFPPTDWKPFDSTGE